MRHRGRQTLWRALPVVFLLVTMAACSDRALTADRLAQPSGLSARIVSAGPFRLLTYERVGSGPTLVAYIEGDGNAWITRSRQSSDPTPLDPFALRLAARDDAPTVLYIARPCQFPTKTAQQGCERRYWGSARYSAEVVDAVAAVIADAQRRARKSKVELIGYSGGGVIATLIAAQRPVERVLTVGANLDLGFWTAQAEVAPLAESIDPTAEIDRLLPVPQIVLAGGRDNIVPPLVSQRYVEHFPHAARPQLILVPEFSHECCWVERWPELLARARAKAPLTPSEQRAAGRVGP